MLFSQILPAGFFLLGLTQAAAVARPRSPQGSDAATMGTATATVASAPVPVQSGVASNCNSFYQVKSGDTCIGIQTQFNNFTLSEFYQWNPAVGTNCQALLAGYYVCIGTAPANLPTTPSPTQPGIASPCSKYHEAVSGDTCIGITSKYPNLTVSQFMEWNPAVGNDCTNLLAGYYYCVEVPATEGGAASPSPSTSPTSNTK